jgi:hypothetical protein
MSATDLNASGVAKELEELEKLIEGEPRVTIRVEYKHEINLTERDDQAPIDWHGSSAEYTESIDTGKEELVFIATKLNDTVTSAVTGLNGMKGRRVKVDYFLAQDVPMTGFFVLNEVEVLSSHNVKLRFTQLPELVEGTLYSRYRVRWGEWEYTADEGCTVGQSRPDWHVGATDGAAMSDVKSETSRQIFRHMLQCLKQMAYDPQCGLLTEAGRIAFHSHVQERPPSSPAPVAKRPKRSGSDVTIHPSDDVTSL